MNIEEQDPTGPEMLRKKAEEKLKAGEKAALKPDIEADTMKLLHELQVHQIELEMQNEELKQAIETAETALKKYTMLYDLSPMGYFTLEEDGSINDLNFTGAEILGDKRYSLVNSNFKLFISKESREVFNGFFKKVYLSGVKESCIVKLAHDEVNSLEVYIEAIVTGDDRKCLLSVIDISGIKKQTNL